MKTGIVLEGGAMRGLFTSGILDVFMENDITFDAGVGTSAGAVFGCNYKSNQPQRVIRYNLKFGKDKRFGSIRSLLKTGDYYSKDFAYRKVPLELDPFDSETYKKNPMRFYVCATNVETGRAIYYDAKTGDERDIEWMRGSASMPLFSNIVEIDGYKLLDGGIVDSVPLFFLEKKGYEKNVVILTRPEGYKKRKNPLMPAMKLAFADYPKTYAAIAERHKRYNKTLDYIKRREAQGKVLVIRPEESLRIKHTENRPAELIRVYKLGREQGLKHIEEVKRFLV